MYIHVYTCIYMYIFEIGTLARPTFWTLPDNNPDNSGQQNEPPTSWVPEPSDLRLLGANSTPEVTPGIFQTTFALMFFRCTQFSRQLPDNYGVGIQAFGFFVGQHFALEAQSWLGSVYPQGLT